MIFARTAKLRLWGPTDTHARLASPGYEWLAVGLARPQHDAGRELALTKGGHRNTRRRVNAHGRKRQTRVLSVRRATGGTGGRLKERGLHGGLKGRLWVEYGRVKAVLYRGGESWRVDGLHGLLGVEGGAGYLQPGELVSVLGSHCVWYESSKAQLVSESAEGKQAKRDIRETQGMPAAAKSNP